MKHLLASVAVSLLPIIATCQESMDQMDIKDFNRYSNMKLTTGEWISVAAGIVLLLIYKSLKEDKKSTATAFGCLGALAITPMLMVVLVLLQKAIGIGLILAAIAGVAFLLFGKKL